MSDLVKKVTLDLCWILCPAMKHRISPLVNYLTSVLVATVTKNSTSSRHHNMIVDITHMDTDDKTEKEEDLSPAWSPLLGKDKVKYVNIRLCNIGVCHPQSGRPLKGVVRLPYLPKGGDCHKTNK